MFKDLLSRCLGLTAVHLNDSQEPVFEPSILQNAESPLDIGEVRGHENAKINLLIAAVGRHDVLLVGPPGEGKTTLARTLPSFLPPLTQEEYESLCDVYKHLPGGFLPPNIPPFIEVSPAIKESGLIGGGQSEPMPGLISQAHGGILFMDEFTEYDRTLLDKLRIPMERGYVYIERKKIGKVFPCRFQLIAATNPCQCGYYGDEDETLCTCRPHEIRRYIRKISGPMLDRIDMVIEINRITVEEQLAPPIEGESYRFSQLVRAAQQIRESRVQPFPNSQIAGHEAINPHSKFMMWTREGLDLFTECVSDDHRFSSRKRSRFAKVARSVADTMMSSYILPKHVEKAYEILNSSLQVLS